MLAMSNSGIESLAAGAGRSLTALATVAERRVAASLEFVSDPPAEPSPVTPSPAPAITVTVGRPAEPDSTYSSLGLSYATSTAWAQQPTDPLSKVMGDNLRAYERSGRLGSLWNGLGASVSAGLAAMGASGQNEWRQSAVSYRPGYREPGNYAASGTTAADAVAAAADVRNTISLKIRTTSGKDVEIAIRFGGDGKAVQNSLGLDMKVSGELSAAEREAIDKLARGLDTTLQGLGGDVPKLDIAGLVGFDTTAIAAVDLKLNTADQSNGLQSFEFRADAGTRHVALQTSTGRLAVDVDLASQAPLGSADQQRAAVQRFLEQFDAANVRSHGEEVLLEQFKTAFAQLNESYPPPASRPAAKTPSWVLGEQDRAALSGLADFQASMSGDFDNGSPTRAITEAGHMRYETAQVTDIKGIDKDHGLRIVQTQTASLRATQERSPNDAPLNKEQGTYDVFRISDDTSTTTAIEYADFDLKSASSEERSSRLDQYERWLDHELVERRSTPQNTRVLRDLTEQLRSGI